MTTAPRAPLPHDHPLRGQLTAELHARPAESLTAPARASCLALVADPASRAGEWQHVRSLAARFGVELDAAAQSHLSIELGAFRLRYERHSEFSRYKFIVVGHDAQPFEEVAIGRVPAEWLDALGGQLIAATHVEIVAVDDRRPTYDDIAARLFDGNVLIGADVGDGAATALTDCRVGSDGFARLLILDRHLTPRQTGRTLQRLVEIDIYRMMALLALPVARELGPFLDRCEAELSAITTALIGAREQDEPALLERLTQLAASIESRIAGNDFRFNAAAAYYELVKRRVGELRETRIAGMPTFQEFTERRLAPAMGTCRAMASRQESLSARAARANELLATSVDISHERQNQALLASMDRRARVQLRLQQTVEGLSVAAFTYYVVGLVGYAAKAAKVAGLHVQPELVMGLSIPLVALAGIAGVHKIKKMVGGAAD